MSRKHIYPMSSLTRAGAVVDRPLAALARGILPALLLFAALCALAIEAEASPLSASLSAETSSTLHKIGSPDRQASASFIATPVLALGAGWNTSLEAAVDQDLVGKRETKLRNAILGLRRKGLALSSVLKFSPGASLLLPLSESSRREQSLLVGTTLAPRISFDLADLGADAITGYAQVSGTRNFHRYQTSVSGSSNRKWSLAPILRLNGQISRKLSISTVAAYYWRWTYRGNRVDEFELTEELSWQFGKDLSLALGHSNAGSALRDSGIGSNVEFFDANHSTVYASLTVSI